MIEFALLRNLWTDAGARDVFEAIVTHCVRSLHPSAMPVRPAPGDDGVDVFVGVFGSEQRVWQAKYFCDGIGDAQKKQIRDSWKTCIASENVTCLREWTLCLPQDLSIDEHKWWAKWKDEQERLHNTQISLMSRTDFFPFRCREGVREVFDLAFRENDATPQSLPELLEKISGGRAPVPLSDLPDPDMFRQALFVRKLELAGISEHRSRRTSFYNYELQRHIIEEGGDDRERLELQDILVRIRDLWEQEYSAWTDNGYGRKFVAHVDDRVVTADRRLRSRVLSQPMMKKGALYGLADLCEVYWTAQRPKFSDGEDR